MRAIFTANYCYGSGREWLRFSVELGGVERDTGRDVL